MRDWAATKETTEPENTLKKSQFSFSLDTVQRGLCFTGMPVVTEKERNGRCFARVSRYYPEDIRHYEPFNFVSPFFLVNAVCHFSTPLAAILIGLERPIED